MTGTSPTGGRFTAEIPVVAAGEGTGAGKWPLLLPGLEGDAGGEVQRRPRRDDRTGRRVALRLFDASGRALGRGEVSVPAWGNAQVALPAAVGLSGLVPEASSLRVEPLEGEGRVVAIATLVDNVSASFSVVTGRPAPQDASDGAGPQAVASIVQAAGIGAFFTTELSISTAAPNAAPLKLTYDFAGTNADGCAVRGSVERDVLLPRDGALPIGLGRNAVLSLFGRGPRTNTSGTLRIEGDGAGRVLARAAVSTPLDLDDAVARDDDGRAARGGPGVAGGRRPGRQPDRRPARAAGVESRAGEPDRLGGHGRARARLAAPPRRGERPPRGA